MELIELLKTDRGVEVTEEQSGVTVQLTSNSLAITEEGSLTGKE